VRRPVVDTSTHPEDAAIALSDVELVIRVNDLLIGFTDDSDEAIELGWLVQELCERYSPESAWALTERDLALDYAPGPVSECELEAARDGMRRREGARMIQRAFGGPEVA
jgi:hypothetical protein